MIYEIIEYINNNPKFKRTFVTSVAVVILIFVIFTLYTTPTSKPLGIKAINTPRSAFARLQGSYLYHFDGLSFLKTDVRSSQTKVLSRGDRWPMINSIYWAGDYGALVTISGGYTYSPAEKVVRELPIKSISNNALKGSYIWYVDFATGEISSVDSRRPENNSYYFDDASKTIYYVANDTTVDSKTGVAMSASGESYRILYGYDTASRSLKILNPVEGVRYVSSVSSCGEKSVCLIGRDASGQNSILRYSNTSKITNIYTTDNSITPTNDPTRFLITKATGDISDKTKIEGYIYSGPYSYELYNISTNKSELAGLSNKQSNYTIPLYSDNNMTIYSSVAGDSVSISHRTKSLLGLYMSTNQTSQDVSSSYMVNLDGYSTSPIGFAASESTKDTYVVSSNLSIPKKPSTPPDVLVQKCTGLQGSNAEYTSINSLYTIYVPLKDDFSSTIDEISKCILKQPNDSFGYMFGVKGTDPQSGRIATD